MAAIHEKIAIITGSSGGIGGAIALRYAREGAKLALADIVAEPIGTRSLT
jgi:NAD(P)-dependent dehydrogenase (short-subunit alcohol dehydrogenase family)